MLFRLLAAIAFAAACVPPVAAQPAPCVDGEAHHEGGTYACQNVDLLARVSLSDMSALSGNDVWGWTDPETGHEIALMGLDNGTFFVDVTTPDAPVLLGKLPTQTASSPWRDMKVYADHAFVVSEALGHGLQVFDLTRLRGLSEDPRRTFSADTVFTGTGSFTLGSAHNVFLNEHTGFAYVVGARQQQGDPRVCAGGLYMVDVRDPGQPAFAGCFAEDGYTHDVQCVVYDGPDARYAGREVCFASNEDTVTIVDVEDKQNTRMLSQAIYPNIGYTHQGWLTEDRQYFLVNDELDEIRFGLGTRTLVFDVQDLEAPEFIGAYTHPTRSITHNLFVRGHLTYASNYTTGLRVLDISGLLAGDVAGDQVGITTLGFFDTYPLNDGLSFDGQWSNYPFFESGIVLASDIQGGLFVLQPTGLATSDEPGPPPVGVVLEAFPNPFSHRATVRITLEQAQHVRVEVLDVLGRSVALLHDGPLGAGARTELSLDADGLPSGTYVVRAEGETFVLTRMLTLVR